MKKKKKKKLIPLRINRKKWVNGSSIDKGHSALLNEQGFMCCLGFACRALGATRGEMLRTLTPGGIIGGRRTLTLKEKVSRFGNLITKDGYNRAPVDDAIAANDSAYDSGDREVQITRILGKLGFDVTFYGKP